ncbi:MAG TPA: (deoxy)nucleoside triphosphate pyrophosphohydrolase [Polyangia bacterium]|nr:(deoxy)nucleoside triphosphate pyrophosphohydrolase [Polyangia bacterium]
MQRTARKQLLVVAALIEQEGRVLVAQRRADQARPLAWEFPGGKVEPGESPSQALVREIEEELACSIEVGAVVDVVFFAYDTFDLIMPVYRATIRAGVPVARQVAAVAWVARAELPTLAFTPADVPLARRLASEPGS